MTIKEQASQSVTFYFMRHGQTYLNLFGRMQGWSDAPLTPEGRLGILRSGYGLKDIHFDALYTSDLRRTVETAQLALKYNEFIGKDSCLRMMPEFREVSFGAFEGLSGEYVWNEIREKGNGGKKFDPDSPSLVQDEMNALRKADPSDTAEDFMRFWTRVEQGFMKLMKRHKGTGQKILIVSHGMTIRNIIHELVPEFSLKTPIQNGAITVVSYRDGHFILEALNQTSHFADESLVKDDFFPILPMFLDDQLDDSSRQ
ncbi:histidine phosphatase family protein [Atopobacter sp. AH10]|nr:histidine phosphatase family protein [Atopobacter sp. AH10]